jgi:serine/tyrosine/threonine adenylyltransferase
VTQISFDNSYHRELEGLYLGVAPTRVSAPQMIKFNDCLAAELGLDVDALNNDTALFSGNDLAQGSQPLAMAYAGHQFGNFVPQLGDGRAILLGEVVDIYGKRRDIQLKGAGPTPFSRRGDGRAALGPVLREYLVSEAMFALGIPATRALAAVLTGDMVYRQPPSPGAVFTRVAASHIRVGTFQFFAARGDIGSLKRLADYVIERHYPDAKLAKKPYLSLFEAILEAQASLIAKWMSVGFIHGVMNTDNMAVSGETIDFGPCAFMDSYDPAKVFSSIDERERYAFSNQPLIAQWNLARLAETLLPLIDEDAQVAVDLVTSLLESFSVRFETYWLQAFRAKIGLSKAQEGDKPLIDNWLNLLHKNAIDFTIGFRVLSEEDTKAHKLFSDHQAFDLWREEWLARLDLETASKDQRAEIMRLANPAIIPRNHRIEEVIAAALDENYELFHRLSAALERPFDELPEFADYQKPPLTSELVTQTFCGT